MDRRAFLHSATLAAAAGAAAGTARDATAETPRATHAAAAQRDWSHRNPKGEPVMRRFNEQRWILDNVIQANGVDWDQSHTGVVIGSGGPSTIPEMAELKKRVVRLCDIAPAFEALAAAREAKAKDARVVLAEVNKDIRNSMSATGFLSFFTVSDTLRDGIQAAVAS